MSGLWHLIGIIMLSAVVLLLLLFLYYYYFNAILPTNLSNSPCYCHFAFSFRDILHEMYESVDIMHGLLENITFSAWFVTPCNLNSITITSLCEMWWEVGAYDFHKPKWEIKFNESFSIYYVVAISHTDSAYGMYHKYRWRGI